MSKVVQFTNLIDREDINITDRAGQKPLVLIEKWCEVPEPAITRIKFALLILPKAAASEGGSFS
jgi:hypothetical protein